MSRPRIAVVEYVYHQLPGKQPSAAESRFGADLASDEQPYVRNIKDGIGDSWTNLDCGWVEHASMLVLTNCEKGGSVLEVSLCRDNQSPECVVEVPSGQSARFKPSSLSSVKVRFREGRHPVTIQLFPE